MYSFSVASKKDALSVAGELVPSLDRGGVEQGTACDAEGVGMICPYTRGAVAVGHTINQSIYTFI